MHLSRRHFINIITLTSLFPFVNGCKKNNLAIYDDSEDIFNYTFNKKISVSNNDIVLFQGDSITDCNRNRSILAPNIDAALGNGYADIITNDFLRTHTSENVSFLNRGVAGNRTNDLSKRWTSDCIDLNPSTLNILIGVNDLLNNFSPNDYYCSYRSLVQETKNLLPSTNIIICEPFLFPNHPAYSKLSSWLHEYRKIVRLIARDFDAVFIPYYDDLIKDEASQASYDIISTDGFHPTSFGHKLMADIWLDYLA